MLLVRIDNQEPRLTEVLHAAQKTDFYKCWLQSLDDDPEHTFDLLPQVDIQHFDEAPERFSNPRRTHVPAELSYPLSPMPKVAVLASGFKRSANVRVLPKCSAREGLSLKADAIAAPIGVLRELAAGGRTFNYPLIAFTGVRHGYFSDSDRDLFWRTFGVPVFEQLTGLDNDVLAEECEAHEGLHVRTKDAIFEFRGEELVVSSLSNFVHPVLRLALKLTGCIEQRLCPCGKPGPRLLDLKPYSRTYCGASV